MERITSNAGYTGKVKAFNYQVSLRNNKFQTSIERGTDGNRDIRTADDVLHRHGCQGPGGFCLCAADRGVRHVCRTQNYRPYAGSPWTYAYRMARTAAADRRRSQAVLQRGDYSFTGQHFRISDCATDCPHSGFHYFCRYSVWRPYRVLVARDLDNAAKRNNSKSNESRNEGNQWRNQKCESAGL